MQTVYVDLYFFINFSMDLLCLYLTSRLMSKKLSLLRGCLAAALGGVYANLSLFFSLGGIWGFAVDTLCLLLCAVAFLKKGEIKRLFSLSLVFAAVSALLGGIMTALYYLLNQTRIFDFLRGGEGDGISVWLFAALALISAIMTLLGGKGATRKMSAADVGLRITIEGRTVTLHGMTDSGNLLRDPLSGKPCIVANLKSLRRVLPAQLGGGGDMLSRVARLRGDAKSRICLIPTRTATGESMLIGLRDAHILIIQDGKEKEVDAIIALSELEVEALVPACLLI